MSSVSLQRLYTGSSSILHRAFQTSNVSLAKKWKLKKPRPGNIDASLLKIDEPVSGTRIFPEDMAKMNSRPFEFDTNALNQRGFLRFQKGYDAPPNAIEQFLSLARSLNPKLAGATDLALVDVELSDPSFKYELLSKAGKEFQHSVPNSLLHYIVTIRDAVKFYNTSVTTSTPYDDLQRLKDLPENLHIQKDPVRFEPETDTMFGGVSAFPQSSTIVTGLRAKKKYKTIHVQRKHFGFK